MGWRKQWPGRRGIWSNIDTINTMTCPQSGLDLQGIKLSPLPLLGIPQHAIPTVQVLLSWYLRLLLLGTTLHIRSTHQTMPKSKAFPLRHCSLTRSLTHSPLTPLPVPLPTPSSPHRSQPAHHNRHHLFSSPTLAEPASFPRKAVARTERLILLFLLIHDNFSPSPFRSPRKDDATPPSLPAPPHHKISQIDANASARLRIPRILLWSSSSHVQNTRGFAFIRS